MTLKPSVHIVDATKGPLVGEGRLDRVMPFAATAFISAIVAVPATSFTRPGLAVIGSVLVVTTIVSAAIVPWHRMPRAAQLVPPALFLAATLLLVWASGHGVNSPFVALIVLPLMWLAIYENRVAVLSAAALTGVAIWLVVPSVSVAPNDGAISIYVLIVCCAGMGVTLHGLVADARALALALRKNQLALEYLSLHDPLTDLSNRRDFAAHAQLAGDHAQNDSLPFSVVYIDVDHFKELNDTLGHEVGDLFLKEVADRLRTLVRSTDTVARLGGDEFAVIVQGVDPTQAIHLADRIEAALQRPYVAAPDWPSTASVGIAHSTDAGTEPDAVLSAADSSMFTRKRERDRIRRDDSG